MMVSRIIRIIAVCCLSSLLSSTSEKKRVSHEHNSSMLTSKHDSRKHGVIDGRVTKKSGGLGYLKNKSPVRMAKEAHLLTPSYIAATVQETKLEVAKPKDKSQSAQATTERYNELCPLMTQMVEDELKNIMIKIWQTLPDDAPPEIEQLVVDKLKGAAGDDLRNAIGLNVTKRLLNVHNGILVKFVIYSTITSSEILEFTKKHRVSEFKHVQRWTYAGRMASWAELDDLYTNKNLKCGNSRVKVSPVYSFLKCPPSLRTIFDGSQSNSKAKNIEMEIARKTKKAEGRVIVTADKVLAEEAKREINKTDKVPETKESKDEVKKTESASKVSTEAKNVAAPKNTVDNTTHKQLISTNIAKKDIGTPKQNKTEVQLKAAEANTTNDKKQTKTQSQTNKEPAKTVANTPSVPTNITKHNTVSKNATKVETKKTVANKPITSLPKKDIVANKTVQVETSKSVANKPSANDKNTASANATKIETTKSVANKPSVASNTTNKNTAVPKPNATKVETAKSVANKPSIATNQNIASPKPNATKVETAKSVANKTSAATNQNIASPKPNVTRVETAKSVANKPSVATNQNIASPKPNATKVETAKSVSNKPAVKTSQNTASPKPNATKVETAKSVANKPSVATNQNTASPKPSTPKVEAKAVANKPAVSINTKKVPNEKKPGITVKEPIKTPIKEPVAKKPVSANSAKIGEAKKSEAKPAKVETPTRIQSKPAAKKPIETPKKEIVKSKPIENRKSDTKNAPKELKPAINPKNIKTDTENDFDELDDHDILALLSSGIVLDECSGSDDD